MSKIEELVENYNKTKCTKLNDLLLSYQHLITFQKQGELSDREMKELQSLIPRNLMPNHNKYSRIILTLIASTQIQITNGVTKNFLEFIAFVGRYFMHSKFKKIRDDPQSDDNRYYKKVKNEQSDSSQTRRKRENSYSKRKHYDSDSHHSEIFENNNINVNKNQNHHVISDSDYSTKQNKKHRQKVVSDNKQNNKMNKNDQDKINDNKQNNKMNNNQDKHYIKKSESKDFNSMKSKQFSSDKNKNKSYNDSSSKSENNEEIKQIRQNEWPIKIENFSWKWPIRLFDERTPCQYIQQVANKNSWISRLTIKDLEQYKNYNTLQLGFERSKWYSIEHTIEAMRMNNAFTNSKTEIDEFLKQLKIEASKPVDDSSK